MPTIEIRQHVTSETLVEELVDRRDALVVLVADPGSYPRSDKTLALTTDAPNFVALQCAYFDALWEASSPMGTGFESTPKAARAGPP